MRDFLEAVLFGVTVFQPYVLFWSLMLLKSAIINGSIALVEKGLMDEKEALTRSRNICAKLWVVYGKVCHGW